MSRLRKATILVVVIVLAGSALGFTASGRGMLKKLYVAVACDGSSCGD